MPLNFPREAGRKHTLVIFQGWNTWKTSEQDISCHLLLLGSDNQLSGCHDLSQVHVLHFSSLFVSHFSLLCCFPGWGWNYYEQRRTEQHAASQCSIVKENPRRRCGPVGLVCTPVTHFWGVTCITAPLRESLCHVYCHVPRYAAWLQTHQTHLQEYWYWECHGEAHEGYRHTPENTHGHDCAVSTHKLNKKWIHILKMLFLCSTKLSVSVILISLYGCKVRSNYHLSKDSSVLDRVSFMLALLYLNLPICHFLCTVVSIVTMPTVTPMM